MSFIRSKAYTSHLDFNSVHLCTYIFAFTHLLSFRMANSKTLNDYTRIIYNAGTKNTLQNENLFERQDGNFKDQFI